MKATIRMKPKKQPSPPLEEVEATWIMWDQEAISTGDYYVFKDDDGKRYIVSWETIHCLQGR